MFAFQSNTFTEAATTLAKELDSHGKEVSTPRTGMFLEIRDVTYEILWPWERFIPYKNLHQSKLWAYSEVLSEFLNLNPPLTEYYGNKDTAEFMQKFHRGDGRANYMYGERWHNNQAFQNILHHLQYDKYSRQAVMNIWDSSIDLQGNETNLPCTIIHQFMVREDKLNLHVYIRSNDFFKGFKYDVYLNSFILEAFAGFLKCGVGSLIFTVGSFHVYENDYPKLHNLVNEQPTHIAKQEPRFSLLFSDLYDQLWLVYNLQNESRYHPTTIPQTAKLSPIFREWANAYIDHNYNVAWEKT
jgi:thymidylate synthase